VFCASYLVVNFKAQTTKSKAQSTKYEAPSPKAQNTKHKAQNTKSKAQNPKHSGSGTNVATTPPDVSGVLNGCIIRALLLEMREVLP
jgi:hypothetical protein